MRLFVQEAVSVHLPFPEFGLMICATSDDTAVVWEGSDSPYSTFVSLYTAGHLPRADIQHLQAALLAADNRMPITFITTSLSASAACGVAVHGHADRYRRGGGGGGLGGGLAG